MDLVLKARCNFCDKIFCCPQHRRSHELLSHPKKCNKMSQIPISRKQTNSYAMEMRKLLYSENNRPSIHKSRKRNYLTISQIVLEQEETELKMVSRKILVAHRKKSEIRASSKLNKTEKNNGGGKYEDDDDADEIISPIEDKIGKVTGTIFTTSTPLAKRSYSGTRHFSAPLESIVEDIPGSLSRFQSGTTQVTSWNRKRKVTFSESVESVYNTASEVTPESRPGIFSAVANAFHAVLHRWPGIADEGEECYAIACSPGGSKKKRSSQRMQRQITGRRPLHQKYSLLSPEN